MCVCEVWGKKARHRALCSQTERLRRHQQLIPSLLPHPHPSTTCQQSKYLALGPDPLREDADKERLWAKMLDTGRPIGQVCIRADDDRRVCMECVYRAWPLADSSSPHQPTNQPTNQPHRY